MKVPLLDCFERCCAGTERALSLYRLRRPVRGQTDSRVRSVFLFVSCLSLFIYTVLPSKGISQNDPWRKIDQGLLWSQFDSPYRVPAGDGKITVVRIDPTYYSFKLLCASELGKIRLTPKEWCRKYNLLCAINAGMYQEDGLTNVGYMKNFLHSNNPRLNSTYKAVLAFNRTDVSVPEIQIVDLKCQDFERLKLKYQTLVQNIRMISCSQENVWTQQDKRWSLAALGIEKGGNALLFFSESPHSGHDFINMLLSLPVPIFNAMYLEGGPEAGLYLSAKELELEKVGIPWSGLAENSFRLSAQPIPNVIGITKKPN